jgi:predicted nucleic acid-binding protein
MNSIGTDEARDAVERFWADWPQYYSLEVDEPLVRRAADVAWQYGLRGYDAVHLASALKLQDRADKVVTVVTFDRHLADAARQSGLATLPEDLEAFFTAAER